MGQPKLFKLIDKAIFDYHLIAPGERILVGASGGKDSTALIDYLAQRKKRPSADFSFTALTIATDVSPALHPEIAALFADWQVKHITRHVSVLERIAAGKRMNCWWCSTQRRTELLDYALQNGYTAIALGHHLDDILETLLMNMLHKGELSTMTPLMRYEKYPVKVIRPLCLAPVDLIKAYVTERQYAATTCTCTYQDNSGRRAARTQLLALTGGDAVLKARLFTALHNVKHAYLPSYEKH
ncbi:MAG: tRNA 2-thiocytidine biosynthesis protein TtcA [Treponema sp.]|nr:tRNA 2-thiocytidine biosynthesis protein TtcA [Treponema sp.]